MEKNTCFSKKESNQSYVLNLLINDIEKIPVQDRESNSIKLITGIYNTNEWRNDATLKFPEIKNKLFDIYVNSVFEQIGIDDSSPDFENKINEYLDALSGKTDRLFIKKYLPEFGIGQYNDDNTDVLIRTREVMGAPDRGKLFRLLSDKIVSQEKVSRNMNNKKKNQFSDSDAQKNSKYASAFEGLLSYLERGSKRTLTMIDFLNKNLTDESIEKCLNDLDDKNSIDDEYKNKESLELFHNTFWGLDLPGRAYVMNKLLNRISKNPTIEDKISFVCNMNFNAADKYRQDAENIFQVVIKSFESYEQSLILAAVACADENKNEADKKSSRSVGEGLRMFFENMGPAWVKFGQMLSYVPNLPSEIREDLAKLKDAADIPARWDLFDSLKKSLPNKLQNKIESVDEILGAGSFWVTAKIKFKNDKTGKLDTKVLSILRPYAGERSQAGFTVVERAVAELAKQDSKYKSLLKVARQASDSSRYEIDVVHGNKQYEKAVELYSDININLNGKKIKPHVAAWEYYGVGMDEIGYKLMDLAPGKTLDRAEVSIDEKRQMAIAYVTIELTNLFKGDVWDIDRHNGQQNFEKLPNGDINVNIYDTGAQINKKPNATDKILLAEVFYGLIRSARTGKSIDKQILRTIDNMDKLESYFKIDTSYASDIQKGLLALSDIMEYQKELKDDDGNIIQERLTLSQDDMANIIEAVYNNISADKKIKMMLAAKIVLNKLRPWRRGWVKSLDEGLAKSELKNPISIDIVAEKNKTNSRHMDKPKHEINELLGIENSNKAFGINKDYVKDAPDSENKKTGALKLASLKNKDMG